MIDASYIIIYYSAKKYLNLCVDTKSKHLLIYINLFVLKGHA